MARNLSEPITPPVGLCAVERPRVSRELSYLTAADRQPIPVLASGEEVDWSALDIPAVARRSEPTTPDELAELRQVCIGYYTRRIAEVEALIEMGERTYYTERLERLRRMLEVAGRIEL